MSQPFPLNPFFSGNYAPISFEADAPDLPLRGELPKELAGTLYRNGPNPQFAPRDPNHHWFIGDGMIHAFHVADGQVSYRNRWVRTPKWELEHKAHRALFGAGVIRQRPIHQYKAKTAASPIPTSSGTAVSYLRWKKVIDRLRSIQQRWQHKAIGISGVHLQEPALRRTQRSIPRQGK